jgi:hypothetical protein
MRRPLACVIAAYLLMLAGALSWHWSSPPPYARPTVGLMLAFGVVATLSGLISIWCAFAATHWSGRASGLIAATAVLFAVLAFFFQWDESLIWQLFVIVSVELAKLIISLGAIRLCGFTIATNLEASTTRAEGVDIRAAQFTVRDLLLNTSALALLFSVLHFIWPIELGATLYQILIWGGLCAAFVSLVALWASFSRHHLAFRAIVVLVAAPVGGVCYRAMSKYLPLLMSAEFYAGVTAVQILCMTVPLAIVRLNGYRFRRSDSQIWERKAPTTPPSPAAR